MSRWAESRPRRVELDPVQRRRVEETRAQRPRPWWPRWLGLALLGCAVRAAIVGDYPLPRGKEASASSAVAPLHLRPELLQPLGEVDRSVPTFAWRWQPPAAATPRPTFDLILLDDQLCELRRLTGLGEPRCRPDDLAAVFAQGRFFYWCVEVCYLGERLRSPLGAFGFSR